MVLRAFLILFASVLLSLWNGSSVLAFHLPAGVACETSKLLAAGKAVRRLVACQARATAKGTAATPSCTSDGNAFLARSFEKAEGGSGCITVGDEPDIQNALGAFATDVLTYNLRPTSVPSSCSGAKLKAAADLTYRLLLAYARNKIRPAPAVLQTGISGAEARFADAFARAENKGDCQTLGDASAIDRDVMRGAGGIGFLVRALFCGDGTRDPFESCDPPGSSCPGVVGACLPGCVCPPAVCGNGVVETGEECDPPGTPCESGPVGGCGIITGACTATCHCGICCEHLLNPPFTCDYVDPYTCIDTGGIGICTGVCVAGGFCS